MSSTLSTINKRLVGAFGTNGSSGGSVDESLAPFSDTDFTNIGTSTAGSLSLAPAAFGGGVQYLTSGNGGSATITMANDLLASLTSPFSGSFYVSPTAQGADASGYFNVPGGNGGGASGQNLTEES